MSFFCALQHDEFFSNRFFNSVVCQFEATFSTLCQHFHHFKNFRTQDCFTFNVFEMNPCLELLLLNFLIIFFSSLVNFYMLALGPLPLRCYCVIYFIHIVCRFYYMVLKLLPFLMLTDKPCMLLGKLLCKESLN